MTGWRGPGRGAIARVMRSMLALLALLAGPAQASCTVTAGGVAFGAYAPLSGAASDSTGTISVTCTVATSYTLALSSGVGTYASRTLTSGSHVLAYNLYTSAARGVVWGDGSGVTATVAGSGTALSHTVYGRIAGGQNAYAGSYADSVTVTIDY